jgi:acyl-CoA synthetase (AMP-forming)/AMP-acid ligase II
MDLAKLVVYSARRYEAEPAIAFSGGVVTYKALMGATAAAAEAIETLRLPPRSVVLLDVRNPVFHTALLYALALCGHLSASIGNAGAPEPAGPKPNLVLTDRDDLKPAADPAVRRIDSRWFAHDQDRPVDYRALLAKPGFGDTDDVFRLIYSSGTTGRPKCVGLSNRTLALRIARAALQTPFRSGIGSILNTMAFSTIIGTMMPFHAPAGGTLLCYAESGGEVLQMVRTFSVSYLMGSVAQVQGVVRALGENSPPPSLRTVRIVGARIAQSQLREMRTRLCNHVISVYGSSEMGRVSNAEPADLERNDGAAGMVSPFVTVEVVDESGQRLPAGQDGIIRVRTEELAVYVDEAGHARSMAAEDLWFYPGDIGHFETDGLLVLTGRTTEVINRGGVVVAPEAIEEVLQDLPGIEAVAVVGVRSPSGVDEIWAAVVPSAQLDAQGILNTVRARLRERTPDRLFQLGRLPTAENGKLMRNAVRDELLRLSQDQAGLAAMPKP